MSSGDLLIRITLNETYTEVVNVESVNNSSNPIPSCEGLSTISITGFPNSIVGFFGNNVYSICHIDGSSQIICPEITPDGIPGAAAIRLSIQQPQPTSCIETNILENSLSNKFIRITPNPSSSQATLHIDIPLKKVSVLVYDSIGKKTHELLDVRESKIILNFKEYSSGIYFIKVFSDKNLIESAKLVINQ